MTNPQYWNLYAYCGNNPITLNDPDGRDTYAILYGDPGKNEHNVGNQFKMAAETRKNELEKAIGKNDKLIFEHVSIVKDFINAVDYQDLKLVEYFGHGGNDALYLGEEPHTARQRTNMDYRVVNVLPGVFVSDGKIRLNACNTAKGGADSIAKSFANRYQVPVEASKSGMVFSKNSSGNLTMTGNMVTVLWNLDY